MPTLAANVGLGIGIVLAASAASSEPTKAMDLKTSPFELGISGVLVRIPVVASVNAKTEGDSLVVSARAEGDLREVQDKALAIAQAVPAPSDNCAHEGANPVVNDVTAASITPSGSNAVISLSGHVTVWVCKRVAGRTIKTEIPPKRIAVTVSAPIKIVLPDPTHVGLALAGPISVSGQGLGGQAASLLANIYQGVITDQLSRALDASTARASLPNLAGTTVNIQTASFASNGSVLSIVASGSGAMSGDAFAALVSRWGGRGAR